jgi:thioredoxin-related protein
MKKYVLLIAFSIGAFISQAQDYDTTAPYKKNPAIPSFKILQPDSTWFTDFDLPKNKMVIIMYFSPECGHCQLEAEDIVKHKEELKNAFFLLVSYHTPKEIGDFAHKYKLDKFPSLRMGRDTEYNLPSFFRVQYTPFLAVYNKKGLLVKTFEMGAGSDALIKLLNDNP